MLYFYFTTLALLTLILNQSTEVVLVEDDDSEIYMQKMSDIMAEGIKKLDKFYGY